MNLEFASFLKATKEEVWVWAISSRGINRELFPILKMTSLKKLADVESIELQKTITKVGCCYLVFFLLTDLS